MPNMKNFKFRRPSIAGRVKRHSCQLSRTIVSFTLFRFGEVYIFHRSDENCPVRGSLWAVFDKCIGSDIYLESSSEDLRMFELWHKLPDDYKYCRLATRAELRDFMFALAWYERTRSIKK